jgi:hypothetical protein
LPAGLLGAAAGAGQTCNSRDVPVVNIAGEFDYAQQNELMGFKIQRVESKRVDQFENMSDEELRQYVYGKKELDS